MSVLRALVVVAIVGRLASPARAADPVATCEKKQTVVVSGLASDVLRCAADAAGRGAAIDPGCLAAAEAKGVARLAHLDAAGGCAATGMGATLAAAARDLAVELRATVGAPSPSRCARAKILAAGKRAKARLKAEAVHATKPEQERLHPLLSKADAGFGKAIANAELGADCGALGDGPAIAAAVDATATTLVDGIRPTLRALATARGLSVGAALRNTVLQTNDEAYATTAVRQFDSITPEFEFMWGNMEAVQGTMWFAPADIVVDFAEQHGVALRGAPLVWHLILPSWVPALTAVELDAAVTTRIQTLLGTYQGRIGSWVVVNEAIADGGSGLRDSLFLQKLGSAYVADAFTRAHQADPSATLYINDYGVDAIGPKSNALYALVAQLKQQGVPIHGVGLQMHTGGGFGVPTKESVKANIARFVALGVEVRITEMDMQIDGAPFPSERPQKLGLQRRLYRELVAACVESPGCVGVDFWGFTDAHTWVNDYLLLDDEPLLFDAAYEPKAAFFGVRDALLGP